ncbi:unnamed protein product [Closterium sp. Yama58-4]|nr:unnamed protein product [Closterium sp. Yama58-4]
MKKASLKARQQTYQQTPEETDQLDTILDLELQSAFDVPPRHYEMIFLVHEGRTDETPAIIEKITEMVKDARGTVWRVNDWGMRRLAYRIQKTWQAQYILMNVEVPSDKIAAIEKVLLQDERVIRHLVTKQDKAEKKDYPAPVMYNAKGEMGSNDESERKKRPSAAGSIMSPPAKRPSLSCLGDEKKIDPSVLQFQNQKLSQQLEVQKERIHELESRFEDLKARQSDYDDTLMTVNSAWNQLTIILAVKANAGLNGLQQMSNATPLEDRGDSDGPSESIFLRKLLQASPKVDDEGNARKKLHSALQARSSQTYKVLKCIVQAVDQQRLRNEELAVSLKKSLSSDEAADLLRSTHEDFRSEVSHMRAKMDEMHLQHRSLSLELSEIRDLNAKSQAEVRRVSDHLEDTLMQLESTRRKLVAAKQSASSSGPGAFPASPSLVKSESRDGKQDSRNASGEARELEAALEEAKKLSAQRLTEIEDKQQTILELNQKLREYQSASEDEQRIKSSRPYSILAEQLIAARAEAERNRLILEQLQRERDASSLRDKDMAFRAEAGDAARRACQLAEARVEELEKKLEHACRERDVLQQRLEEAHSSLGRKETVAELKVMIATLHKEMSMMQAQLTKHKEAAQQLVTLRADNESLKSILSRKAKEIEQLGKRILSQASEQKALKAEVAHLKSSECELQMFMDMFERESTDTRDMKEVKSAEVRALAQVAQLRAELDEHGLALRVKAANEAEAACQQRLVAAEAEIGQLRQQLDETEKRIVELQETVKAKEEEGEAYITEIETIGAAYEEMQSQNRRLLQQISERDEYNTQLIAEGVKARQLQASLQAEKQSMETRMQHATAAADVHKQRVVRLEEQVKSAYEQLAKAVEDARGMAGSVEAGKRKQAEMERETAAAREAMEGLQKDLSLRNTQMVEVEEKLETERNKRRRVEEERDALSARLARLGQSMERGGGSGGPSVEQLQEELRQYKSIMKCSVCHDRQKEVVITKCFHLFCSPCIQKNLELRHRKCPGCGVPFGQNDVRNVYI